MTDITARELESQAITMLPERETLVLDFNWSNVYASNSSLALNAATILSAANSAALQNVETEVG